MNMQGKKKMEAAQTKYRSYNKTTNLGEESDNMGL